MNIPSRSRRSCLPRMLLVMLLLPVCFLALWYGTRPLPVEKREELYRGITYYRSVRLRPRPILIHILIIDLTDPGISFLVTPGRQPGSREGAVGGDLPYPAQTTSQFLKKYRVQVAINGDGFTPWHSVGLFDYYPHAGEGVETMGLSASRGKVYSDGAVNEPTLYISKDNEAGFDEPADGLYNAISGSLMLAKNGEAVKDLPDDQVQPRTGIALSQDRKRMLIFVIDGRQWWYSEGVTLAEFAQIMVDYGGYNAINLDGGGSTTMVKQGWFGMPDVLNSPIDLYIPGRQRAAANHLGIYVKER